MQNYNILRNAQIRTLPTALAHCLAACKPSHQNRLLLLNRLSSRLSFADNLKLRLELAECRAAQRGQRLASVA